MNKYNVESLVEKYSRGFLVKGVMFDFYCYNNDKNLVRINTSEGEDEEVRHSSDWVDEFDSEYGWVYVDKEDNESIVPTYYDENVLRKQEHSGSVMNKIEQAVLDTGGDWDSITKMGYGMKLYLLKSTQANSEYVYPKYARVDSEEYYDTDDHDLYWERVCTKEEYDAAYVMMNKVQHKTNYDALITLTKRADMNIAFYTDNKVSIYADDEDVTFEHTAKNIEIITDYLKAKIALEDME